MDDIEYAADTEEKELELPINPSDPVKKRRGRKPKNNGIPALPKEKKKRGRKPKLSQPENDETKRTRKRGRKPKIPMKTISELRRKYNSVGTNIEFESAGVNNEDPVQEIDNEQKHVSFGNLNILVTEEEKIDTSDIKKILFEQSRNFSPLVDKIKDESDFNSPVQSESEAEVINMGICKDCKKSYGKEVKEKSNTKLIAVEKKRVHKQLYGFSKKLDETKQWPESSNNLCWWCCHSYNNRPVPSVIRYDERLKVYKLKGLFCSWECSAAFTLDNRSPLCWLYKLMKYWLDEKHINIIPAPSRFVLKSFGGHMTINEYRKCKYQDRKFYLSEDSRMSYVNQDILEIYKELERKKIHKEKLVRKKKSQEPKTILTELI